MEMAIVGADVAAAAQGLRPIVELMFIDFIGVCLDQICNQAAKFRYMSGGKVKVPLVIRTAYGGGLGAAEQHSQCLYSMVAHIPGLKVVIPSTPYDAKGLLISSLRQDDPVVYFEHKLLYGMKGKVPEQDYVVPIGKADVKREGRDITIVAIGRTVHTSIEAATKLQQQNVSAEIVDLRSLSPLDEQTILDSVKRTGRLVVVDEDTPRCSVASEVAALVASMAFDYLDAPVRMIGSPNVPVPFSPVLERVHLPSPEKIVEVAQSLI